jgi:lipopolysaccharide/colanic/teichoic acid biosynthesis glycosyltransferase
MMKRSFDLILVLLCAPLWAPLLALTAVLVRIKLGSPVLFRQLRPGFGGQPFQLLKFRTMTDARDDKGNYLPDAQRLTRFGCWLRSTSLDEFPELLNVLRGEMSLVGPRPLLMQYLPRYTPEQAAGRLVRGPPIALAEYSDSLADCVESPFPAWDQPGRNRGRPGVHGDAGCKLTLYLQLAAFCLVF